jgi:hypothetical protein
MSTKEVVNMVGLMFDMELTKWPGDVPAPFSSENPPPPPLEVRFFRSRLRLILIIFLLINPGAYPEVIVDVVPYSGDEVAHSAALNVSVDLKVPVAYDTVNVGAISAEALAPGPIGADATDNLRPPITDQAPTIPPSSERGQKHLCLAAKRSDLVPRVDQVMIQVELPP